MIKAQNILRWLLRACLGALLAYTLFMAVLYWFIQRNPAELVDKYLSEISAATGLQFSLGAVDVTLLPLPAIAVTDLSIKNASLDFSAAWVSLRPSLLKIIAGDFMPAQITLLRPRLRSDTSLPLDEPARALHELGGIFANKSSGASRGLPEDCLVEISHGEADISGADKTRLILRSLQANLAIGADNALGGNAHLASMRLTHGEDCMFSLENLQASGETNLANFLRDSRNLRISAVATLRNVFKSTYFNVEFNATAAAWNSSLQISGDLDLNGEAVPVAISGRASRLDGREKIRLHAIEWNLDADSGRLDGILALPGSANGFGLDGILLMHRGSLTQWLGFARNLAPGLQLALDNITSARLEFHLTSHGLQVPAIEATCLGFVFRGSGSVADFSQPVVALDMKTDRANLGLGIPESLGKSPPGPHFPYPPLTPLPGEPLKPGETGIGYDIKLGADTLVYGPLVLRQASLRIHPGKLDSSGLGEVLLDGQATLYGAPVKGSCVLGPDKSLPISISGTARSVNAALLAEALPILPVRQGRLNADVKITSKGKKLDVFLANLAGQISTSGDKATLMGIDGVFSRIEGAVNLRGASLDTNRAGFDGKWRASLKNDEYTATGHLDGRIWFGDQGATFKNMPAEVKIDLEKGLGPLPGKTSITAKGTARVEGGLEFTNARLSLPGITASGNLRLPATSTWQGNFTAEIADLPQYLKKLGLATTALPAAVRNLKMSADFTGNKDQLKLSKIKAAVAQSNIAGNLTLVTRNAKPHFDFALNIDRLDMERLGGRSGTKQAKSARFDFSFMRSFSAKGDLRLRELAAWGIRMQDLALPLRLEGGRLAIGPATGTFYEASMQNRASIDFNDGLAFNTIFAVHGFNLAPLARDRKLEGQLAGRANLDAKLEAKLTHSGQIPAALYGEWSFNVKNGSWQSFDKNGKPSGSPTVFTTARASGKIEKGILRSSDFTLSGPGMQVDGKGWLNLNDQKIDGNLEVSMKGLPDFPLRIYGTLGKTKTSIGAGKMVINAIGGITSGFINILGGMAEGALNIFR